MIYVLVHINIRIFEAINRINARGTTVFLSAILEKVRVRSRS